MEALLGILEEYFVLIIEYLILIIECIGVGVLVVTIIRGIIEAIRNKDHMRLNLMEGIALAIEFKMGGELLRGNRPRVERDTHSRCYHPPLRRHDFPASVGNQPRKEE